MRYFWALMAYVVAIVVAVASCGGNSGTGGNGTLSGSGGSGGVAAVTGTGNGSGTLSSTTGAGAAGTSSTSVGTFVGSSTSSSSGDSGPPMCPGYMTCADQKFTCGMQSDGCGNLQDCGSCPPNQACANGTCTISCTPMTCMQQGFNCGFAGDGCGGTIACGPTCPAGQSCGAGGMPNVCGTGMTCTALTCMQQGFNCGMQGDTCGHILDCGTCTGNDTCGGGGVPGVCGSMCTPKTCADQKFNCGMATDGCGGVISCGTCPTGQTCGSAGPNQCGSGTTCSGPLCSMIPTCTGGGTTTITGTVYAPNGTDPLYSALVYVPNGPQNTPTANAYGVTPFTPGVSCAPCGADVSGNPLVTAVTGVNGTFTITGAPAGADIPLVIQLGRWRREILIPNVAACSTTAVTAALTTMPNCESSNAKCPAGKIKGDIPLMAFATGSVDALECVFRKIGVDDTEFTDPGGTGRIQLYKGWGSAGASVTAAAPYENTALWNTQAEINQYDIVLFPCQGSEFDRAATPQSIVQAYANAGGRVFTTHYSYVWLFKNAPWNTTATWTTGLAERSFCTDPNIGYINMSFPKGQALAQWLQVVGASTTLGQIQINTLRGDVKAVNAPGQLWMTVNDPGAGCAGSNVPMQYDFTTPTTAPAAQQCGRVVYNDYHVEDIENNPSTGEIFPKECAPGAMTAQEKLMEFMLFDLASCAQSGVPMCTPTTCTAQGATCGPIGDGCGNILQCGMCPSGQACINGTCGSGCTPKTCAQQGFTCGMQGDTCGNALDCGMCPSGMACINGTCGSGTCTPHGCGSIKCGSTGDGCGNIQQCGMCPTGDVCVDGMCVPPKCTPTTCAALGYNCGMTGDGCSGTLNCGTCQAPESCGGGGKANVCGGGGGA